MDRIRCLLTDDEPLAMDILASYIESLDFLELTGRCSNAIETLNFLQRHKVDLLFLDIQMPRLTGVDMLRTLTHRPKVVLTTAYRDYALEGYELNVLDYLLKPVSFDRFLIAVNKYYQQVPIKEVGSSPDGEGVTEALIDIKAQKKMIRILLKDILYIESLRDYIKIKTTGQVIVSHGNISCLEEKLPQKNFLRIHRSFIVAMDKIKSYTTTSVTIGLTELPIGRFYKGKVLAALQSAPSL